MPIRASAKKSLRVSSRKAIINRRRKLLIKAALKNVTTSTLPKAISLVDKGAKWGIFHRNKAARLKAKLMRTAPSETTVTKKVEKPAEAKSTTKISKPSTVKKSPKPAKPARVKTKKPTGPKSRQSKQK